jgi:hypothetical protein
MSMTRADFETIASVIHDSQALDDLTARALALDMAEALCAGSDSFDPIRFAKQVDVRVTRDEVVDWSHALRLRVLALEARRSTPRN